MFQRDDSHRLNPGRNERRIDARPLFLDDGVCDADEGLSDVLLDRFEYSPGDVILKVYQSGLLIRVISGVRQDVRSFESGINVPIEPRLREVSPVLHRHDVDRLNLLDHRLFLTTACRIQSFATRANAGDCFIRRSTSSSMIPSRISVSTIADTFRC